MSLSYLQHVPFEGVISIDINNQAGEVVAANAGEWKVCCLYTLFSTVIF